MKITASIFALTLGAGPAFAEGPIPASTANPVVPAAAKSSEATGKGRVAHDDDVAFVRDASALGLAELETSKAAQTRGTRKEVRAFAQMMVKDHNAASEELRELASSRNIPLATALTPNLRKDVDRVVKDNGVEFDLRYMTFMVDSHEKALALYDQAANHAKDEELQELASAMLPKLQAHQRQAREIKARLEATAAR